MEGSRREARERAVSLLYEAEVKGQAPAEVLAGLPVVPDRYVTDLVRGVGEHRARIDELIAGHAIDWSLERMPSVDRNILRMAVFELLERPDVPSSAVLAEAVDLAARFGTDESSRFVNGLLASVARAVRPAS
jgi:transcription antitermination protein NusB